MADRPGVPVGELEPTLAVGDAPTLTDVTPPPAAPGAPIATGDRLGRYRLGARLGSGAMGVVWAARDTRLDRAVAVKVLNPAFARVPEAAARLLREARAMAQVSHRAVVAIHDAGEAAGQLYLAMELVDGTTLGRRMRDRAPAELADWRRWLGLLVEAGRGLAAAHAAGIVHRDFKPENVLVATDGRVCVGDFGVAELSAVTRRGHDLAPSASAEGMPIADLTVTGALVGTPAYMSPEQLRGVDADARSDQFSFCVALHEALYGRRPFALPTQLEHAVRTLIETIEAGRVEPAPADTRVPRWVRDAVLRGLAPSPADRWPDMPSLLAALTPPRRRWPRVVAIVAAAAVVAGVVAIAVPAARRSTAAAVPVDAAAAPAVARALFKVPMRHMIAVSPDGARIAVGNAERVVVHATDGNGVWQFSQLEGRTVGHVAFTEVDRLEMSLFAGGVGAVVTWELSSDRVVATRALPPRGAWYGEVVGGDLIIRPAGTGWEIGVHDGASVRVISESPGRVEASAISPDRARVAYLEPMMYGGRAVVVDVTTGVVIRGEPIIELAGLAWRDDGHLLFTTGTTVQPAIHEVEVGAAFGARRVLFTQERGWFGQIAAAAGRLFFVDSANSFRAKMVSRGGAVQDLDPELVGAGMGWLDDAGWLFWNRATGDLAPYPRGARVPAALDGEPGNATRAGDIAIVAMRKPGGREVVGVSLAEARRLWTLPVGTVSAVRCAGDVTEPCVAVVQPDEGEAQVRRIDARTGALGDELARARTIQDVALSADAAELLVCDGSAAIRAITLATGAERRVEVPFGNTRGVAYDPTGGFLVAGTKPPVKYQILQLDGDRREVLIQSDNEILFLPRPSPDGSQVLVMGRLFQPELYELRL